MIEMLDPREGETIYDPACGTGGMLLAAVQHVKEQHGDVKRLWGKLYGQEKNLTTSSIARMNLFLHGIEDFQIVRGDTLRNPAFFDGDRLANFDCVIANPPFSLEKWGEEQWINDPFGRNFAGLPPPVRAISPGCSTWSSRWPRSKGAWLWCCRRARCFVKALKAAFARSCWRWI
jgi:type I restriction enzyme M protein